MNLSKLIIDHVSLSSFPTFLARYEIGRTPVSTWSSVLLALATYFVVIIGVQDIMRPRKPIRLAGLFQVHNIILSSTSFVLLILIVEEIAPIVHMHGFFYGICGKGAWTPKLEFYYMVNYYFKYLELLDTIFLALKKKPLTFLHVFHHSATALLCFVQLNTKPSMSWVPITLNLSVHVLMYYYYYAAARGQKIWWKKYLTSMQIMQFVVDLFVLCFAGYAYFSSIYLPRSLSPGTCTGTGSGWLFACSLITSYLFLFVSFYKSNYKVEFEEGVLDRIPDETHHIISGDKHK